MDMATRIKERRIAMGYTQEELATKLGLQKSAIAKYENGRVENIKRSIIQKMSFILECSPCYLMGWDDVDIPATTTLDSDEEHLIDNYRKLNDTGKEMSRVYVSDLAYNPKYTSDIRLIQAAHPRTDINIPDGANTNDDEFFD